MPKALNAMQVLLRQKNRRVEIVISNPPVAPG
jgi:hypothetical protein